MWKGSLVPNSGKASVIYKSDATGPTSTFNSPEEVMEQAVKMGFEKEYYELLGQLRP